MKKKNPFKDLETNKEVPPEVRERLLSELAGIQLVSELANHFTLKLGAVFKDFFPSNKKRK